jgi:hypothetical protein
MLLQLHHAALGAAGLILFPSGFFLFPTGDWRSR